MVPPVLSLKKRLQRFAFFIGFGERKPLRAPWSQQIKNLLREASFKGNPTVQVSVSLFEGLSRDQAFYKASFFLKEFCAPVKPLKTILIIGAEAPARCPHSALSPKRYTLLENGTNE